MDSQLAFIIGAFIADLFLSGFFAGMGSLSSVRGEWHREDIYSRCIRPYVSKVIALPATLGWICALLVFFILFFRSSIPIIPQIELNESQSLLVAIIAGMLVSFVGARRRGARIYSANVRRAGYLDIDKKN